MIERYTSIGDFILSDKEGEFVLYEDVLAIFRELASKGLLDKEAYQIILTAIAQDD